MKVIVSYLFVGQKLYLWTTFDRFSRIEFLFQSSSRIKKRKKQEKNNNKKRKMDEWKIKMS